MTDIQDVLPAFDEELDFDEELPSLTESLLRAQCGSLVADGLTGKRLMAALFDCNERMPEPAAREFIYQLCEPCQNPLEAAIESDDVREIFKVAPLLARLAPLDHGLAKLEIKEKFGKRINMNDLDRAITDEKRRIKLKEEGEKKDVADIARDWASEHRDAWAYDTVYEVWRMWNGVYWQEQPKTHLLDKEAVAALQACEKDVTTQSSINLFERMAEADCIRDFTRRENLINFDNGTLDIETGLLRPYSKDDNLTYCLPYCYNPYGSHPTIDQFLAEVLPDEYARRALMAHAGLALMGDVLLHFFFVLLGSPRSGKSTLLALLNALVGASDPYAFAGHSIFSRDVEGKRARFKWGKSKLACVDELPAEALREEELLKAMSAHSGVEMRGIGKDEHTDNRWRPKLIMATNEQPRYSDHSSAIKERSIFAEITSAKPKEERDAKLFQKLVPELGAFAAECIHLAKQALERGYYPLSAEMKALIDRIAEEGNPLRDFLSEEYIIDGNPDSRVASDKFHAHYEQWCDDHGHTRKMTQRTLTITVRTMHPDKVTVPPYAFWIDGVKQRGLVGIRLRTEFDPEPTKTYTDDEPLRLRCLQSEKPSVDVAKQPVERADTPMSTLSTQEESNSTRRDTLTPCNGHAQGVGVSIEKYRDEKTVDNVDKAHSNGFRSHSNTSTDDFRERDSVDVGEWEEVEI